MADPLEKFTPAAQEILRFAQMEATRMRHATIGPEHILLGLLLESEGVAGRVLRDMGLRPQQAQQTIVRLSNASHLRAPEPELRQSTKTLLQMALEEAQRRNSTIVDTQHILLALLRQQEGVIIAVLTHGGLSADAIRRRIERFMPVRPQSTPAPQRVGSPQREREHRGKKKKSVLEQVAVDLTKLAQEQTLGAIGYWFAHCWYNVSRAV